VADIEPGGHWSHTLGQDLRDCHRMVYYRVYGSWGGWTRSGPPTAHLLYQVKHSDNLHTYVGSLVHQAAQSIIQRVRGRLAIAPNQLMLERIEERMRFEIDYSAKELWRRVDNPRRATLILRNHLLGEDIHSHDIEEAIDKAKRALLAFLETYLPTIRQMHPKHILLIDSLDSIVYRDFHLFLSPDFVAQRNEERVIIDWKTGKKGNVDQLKAYALYLIEWEERERNQVLEPSTITGRSVPLLHLDNEEVLHMTPEHIAEARRRIDEDIDTLKSLHSDGVARNEQAFEKTLHRGNCETCAFRFHCDLQPR